MGKCQYPGSDDTLSPGWWMCEALPLCRAQLRVQLGQGLGLRVRQCFREGSLFLALFQYCEHLGTIGQDEWVLRNAWDSDQRGLEHLRCACTGMLRSLISVPQPPWWAPSAPSICMGSYTHPLFLTWSTSAKKLTSKMCILVMRLISSLYHVV